MKRSALFLCMVLFMVSCHTSKQFPAASHGEFKINTPDRDGSSIAKAIIIEEKSEGTGVNAEYSWLDHHFPGYKSEGQALIQDGHVPYDVINIKTRAGEELKIYFDISNYFGKF
jgi:ABC-type glycerol-3-phosphate transport system substrate-binding protein